MKTTYLKKITKLQKKLEKIEKKFNMGFGMDYANLFTISNRIADEDGELKINHDEFEYITFENIPLTFDGEERVKLVLREDDMRNLRESKKK